MLEKLFAAANAVKAGQSLQDSAKWKNVTLLMGPMGVILLTAANFMELDLSESQLNAINYGICTLLVLLYTYFTAATSTKVGLPPKNTGKKSVK